MRLEYQDSIDRYLLNRMSDEERTAFEAKCANNPELKDQLEHTQDVKVVISERSKMLEKIQGWDDEYEEEKKSAARKKRAMLYWTSGIAAAFVMGYFLFPNVNKTDSDPGNLEAMSHDYIDVSSAEQLIDSLAKPKDESEKLMAHNDVDKRKPNKEDNSIDEEQVFSFGKGDFKTSSPHGANGYEEELRRIKEEKKVVTDKIAELSNQLNSGTIDKDVYASMIHLLNYQRDNLNWREAQALLKLNRKKEALAILRKMKSAEGEYQNKADSLYKATINNE